MRYNARLFRVRCKSILPERYRSGHNGADSKSDGGLAAPRGFESHPLRQISTLVYLLRFFSYTAFPPRKRSLPPPSFILPSTQGRPRTARRRGTPRRWSPVTPSMAAGMTDHVWTTAELLSYRVPAEFIDQLPTIEQVFPDFGEVDHTR